MYATLIETKQAELWYEEFIPYYPSLINLLFDTRKKYGCHQK